MYHLVPQELLTWQKKKYWFSWWFWIGIYMRGDIRCNSTGLHKLATCTNMNMERSFSRTNILHIEFMWQFQYSSSCQLTCLFYDTYGGESQIPEQYCPDKSHCRNKIGHSRGEGRRGRLHTCHIHVLSKRSPAWHGEIHQWLKPSLVSTS